MLEFIVGRAQSGKSYEVCRRIAESVKRGAQPILIIPEQFSFESEKRILSMLGDRDAQKVKVLSFSRLCDEVENLYGGGAVGEISDSDKIILINTALKNTRDRLKYFGKYSLSSGLSKMMLSAVGEFKLNGVSATDIFTVSEGITDSVFKRKLYDTACVYAEYEELLFEKFEGAGDRLSLLYETLKEHNYFCGKEVFIDSFSGFTGIQYKIIDRILSGAESLTVSFCENVDERGALGIFANVRKAKSRISAIAQKHGVMKVDDIVLQSGKFVSTGISAVEEFMCKGKTDGEVSLEDITVCRAATAYDEAQFVARNIRRIVREKGARYSDFVVVARNASEYEQLLSTAFEKNKISYFADKRLPLYSLPPAAVLKAAMELSFGITTEKILRFHKSGVEILSDLEISRLENYVFIWNIDGTAWTNEWTMDPRGLDKNKFSDDDAISELEEINALRLRAIAPIDDFKAKFVGTVRDMASAAVGLLESVKDSFLNISDNYKNSDNIPLSDGIITAYSKVMKILDSIVKCLPQSSSQRDFYEAFKNCADIETVGVIPQTVDEVVFGEAQRIQPSRPSYVFVLGANQGVFPRAPKASGVFSISEIGKLINLGIDIPDCSVHSAIDEDLLVYNCVCCANKGVFISFNGASGEPSHFVKALACRFSLKIINEPDNLSENNLPETKEDAFSRLCRSEHGKSDFETLKSVLQSQDSYISRVNSVCSSNKRPQFNIPRELSLKLVGKNISLSPSRFDTYSRCAFMYFCKYALSVKSLEAVNLSAMQSGTLVHFVLEKFVEFSAEKTDALGKAQIHSAIERFVNEYLSSIKGYREAETPHLRLMVANMTETLKYLGERLVSEFKQSDFRPQKCELLIGKTGDMPALTVPVDSEVTVSVNGAVDRLDRYGGYVRVIDYKTGKREFKLPDILVGQNMQMLIYLYAVCRDENFGGIPAGIFYMNAALPEEDTPKARRMNGFMPEDEDLIFAMDKSGNGEYIPQSSPKARLQGVTNEDFTEIFDFLEFKLKQTGSAIANGVFSANPVDGRESAACKYCDFASICRIEKEKPPRVENMKKEQVMEEMRRQVSENGV